MYTVVGIEFLMGQYYVPEIVGYVEIGVILSGGTSATPITVIVTPTEISALGTA